MKKAYKFFILGLLTSSMGCVSVQSTIKSDAVPSFQRVLIVTKMRNAPADSDSYVRQLARLFPAGYETCTLALTPLSFDSPDDAIRKQAEACNSEVILTLELVQRGYATRYSSSPYQYNAEMRSVTTGQPFWKAVFSTDPRYGSKVPPRSLVKRLIADHIIAGPIPSPNSWQASR
ncbi:hypothetical protein [Spirosoma sp.]|uniref:hypothetical protein n=1 Tax=Spirosoma sp. TaxID=1899569 RepID=UPI003B3A92F0